MASPTILARPLPLIAKRKSSDPEAEPPFAVTAIGSAVASEAMPS